MTALEQARPIAWMCELAQEDGTTRVQFVTEDPAGIRWNDSGEPSPFKVTPLYAALSAQEVPAGEWVMVPREPTPLMLSAIVAQTMAPAAPAATVWASVLSAAPAAPKQEAWRPIETAPTDGTEFLANKPGIGLFTGCILDSDHPDCEYDGGVHVSWDHSYVDGVTHWMPLPAAPAAPQD